MSTNTTQFFYSLTPERILDAVEEIGVRCTGRAFALNSMENRVYEIELESDTGQEFVVAKFYRPGRWSEQQILEEHEFLADLAEVEIPVVAPLKFKDGSTLKELPGEAIYYCVFPKAKGRTIDELQNDQLEQMGRLLSRLHLKGESKVANDRISLNPSSYGRENLSILEERCRIPAGVIDRYKDAVNKICDESDPWFESAEHQRIHGDCHLGNILWANEQCFIVDFDDMVNGPCVQDLWLLSPGRDEYAKKNLDTILKGYEKFRDFDYSTLRLIEPLRALRIVHFSAWIAKRWDDPSFKRIFIEFDTDKYWAEQLAAIEEIVRII